LERAKSEEEAKKKRRKSDKRPAKPDVWRTQKAVPLPIENIPLANRNE
jgi:hypothetical protein